MTKERELLEGALRVFARDGYSRANIQALASEAGVSTRTIYNQFRSKDGLFRAVILDSATRVADSQIARLAEIFDGGGDLRETLLRFGRVWVTPDPATQTHFEMVRQIHADSRHISPDALRGWRTAGPDRVRQAIAGHLQALADAGLLTFTNAQLAATHLVQLTAGSASTLDTVFEADVVVAAGVDTFIAAYAPRQAR